MRDRLVLGGAVGVVAGVVVGWAAGSWALGGGAALGGAAVTLVASWVAGTLPGPGDGSDDLPRR